MRNCENCKTKPALSPRHKTPTKKKKRSENSMNTKLNFRIRQTLLRMVQIRSIFQCASKRAEIHTESKIKSNMKGKKGINCTTEVENYHLIVGIGRHCREFELFLTFSREC